MVVVLLFTFTAFQCGKANEVNVACVKGKYLGISCEGVIIQLLDKAPIGKSWKGSTKDYQNCVLASLDSTVFKGTLPTVLARFKGIDSSLYFTYKDGGYPQKEYILCNQGAFITITGISETACP